MLKIYNTYSRSIEEFKPLDPGLVTFYSCGPTVYDYAHIGNLRAYIVADIVKRTLQYNGYAVKHAINITDVGHLTSDSDEGEDKMVKAIKREGLDFSVDSMMRLASIYTDEFKNNVKALNIIEPDIWPKATDHINEMISIIADLIDKDVVYETSKGFYLDTSKVKDYGKLGLLDKDELKAGARIEVDPEKKNPFDFAVWIKAVGENAGHVMNWEAPFSDTPGFPGWHIECSAMAMKHLGETIDIHSGGIDHIKVHHTNEIAQSEPHTGKQFVRYWVHNEFVVIDKAKMSKSAGTFITLKDLIAEGYDPLAYRFLLLQSHYRSPISFSFESLEDAQNGLHNLYRKYAALGEQEDAPDSKYVQQFTEIINDDFDTPKAVALMFEVLKDGSLTLGQKRATILDFDRVLGLGLSDLRPETVEIPADVEMLAQRRLDAKKAKDFEAADQLREQINELGWEVADTPEGFEIRPKQ